MDVIKYNKNYVKKLIGYFQHYIYKYNDYIINKNILEPELLKGRIGIIYLKNKTLDENITSILILGNFSSYKSFVG
jgi:hypothetical protein